MLGLSGTEFEGETGVAEGAEVTEGAVIAEDRGTTLEAGSTEAITALEEAGAVMDAVAELSEVTGFEVPTETAAAEVEVESEVEDNKATDVAADRVDVVNADELGDVAVAVAAAAELNNKAFALSRALETVEVSDAE